MCDVGYLKEANYSRGDRSSEYRLVVVAFLLFLVCLTAGCGSISSNSANTNANALSLNPDSATVGSLQQLQFTARIKGIPTTAVTWSASAGTISNSGIFTAPKVLGNTPVVVTAVSGISSVKDVTVALGRSRASVAVTVIPANSLEITSSALPSTEAKQAYLTTLTATGGMLPYQWSVTNGTLPSGIQLGNSSGVITGTSLLAGSYPFTAKVTDATGQSARAAFILTVSSLVPPAPAFGSDGPAELPRVYLQSAMSNTPAPGSIITVNSGGDLQSALNNASCGDSIQLQAGATFTGGFTFPAKSCDDNHWIIVRTSADDTLLPAEGSRVTPCYAGISSLPGRPAFNCASPKNILAKLVLAMSNNGPITFASGANHYRLTGLEITRLAGTGMVNALISVKGGGKADNIILDRVWLHGTAQDETTRGVELGPTTQVSIVDSFFTDFHCVVKTGSCVDSQAILGGTGDGPMGPYKIVNNFLEAASENVLFGGGAATAVPVDIEIRQNHLFKPLTWMGGQPGYVGGRTGNPFMVKNLFELKNAQRVLLEGNVLENTWGGFTQVGYAVLLTPKNAGGCSICQVTDVTIRRNSISHVGAGLQIANALSDRGQALDGQRYSIHDIVVDDIDGAKYNGPGIFAQVAVSAGAPLLQNVAINHVTAFPSHTLLMIGDMVATSTPMRNFVFTNSIVNAGAAPVWSTGGGPGNCAFHDDPQITFDACFTGFIFTANAIISGTAGDYWPKNNFLPASAEAVEFVNYNGGIGGDYHLQPSSAYKGKGTDGKDLGADMDAINSAIAGVE